MTNDETSSFVVWFPYCHWRHSTSNHCCGWAWLGVWWSVVVVPWLWWSCHGVNHCLGVVLWSWLTGWVGRKVGGGTYRCVNINKNYERRHHCRLSFGTFHSIASTWASVGDMALPRRCCCGGCGATDVEGSGC